MYICSCIINVVPLIYQYYVALNEENFHTLLSLACPCCTHLYTSTVGAGAYCCEPSATYRDGEGDVGTTSEGVRGEGGEEEREGATGPTTAATSRRRQATAATDTGLRRTSTGESTKVSQIILWFAHTNKWLSRININGL